MGAYIPNTEKERREMLKAAGLGCCMSNGTDDAKAAADYVTTDIDKEGIAKALRHFGLV